MKKKISLVICAVLVLALAIVPMFALTASADDTATYTFSDYTAGTQYAENEEHVLDDVVTMYTTQAHFTTQLRLYSSSSHDGYAVIESTKPISAISVNAGNNADTLNVYASTDEGSTWNLVAEIATTSSYADCSAELGGAYNYLKLDVAGSKQVRIKSMTLTFAGACTHEWDAGSETLAPTCGTEGEMTYTCGLCSDTKTEPIAATGEHTGCDDYICDVCSKAAAPKSELTVAEAIALANATGTTKTQDKYYVTGQVTSITNTSYGNMIISDGTNTFTIYGSDYSSTAVKPVAGDTVTFYGVIFNYNNATPEMENAVIIEVVAATCDHVDADGDYLCDKDCGVVVEPADGTVLTFDQATALGVTLNGGYTTNKFYITGVITEVYNITYGNMYIEDENGNSFTVYGAYSADGSTRYDAMDVQPVTGDTITVYGIIGSYSGAAQMKNGWVTEHIAHEHDYQVDATVDATCTEAGSTSSTCSICSGTKTEEIPATGHTMSSLTVHTFCEEEGYITCGCRNCGETFDSRTDEAAQAYLEELNNSPYMTIDLSAKGHNYECVENAPTCTEAGSKVYTCANGCGSTYSEPIEAKGHRYGNLQVFTFCEEAGYIVIGCPDCGSSWDSRTDKEAQDYLVDYPFFNLNPQGHAYDENGVCTRNDCGHKLFNIDEAKVNVGANLGMKWYVVVAEGVDASEYTFTINFLGEDVVLEGEAQEDGRIMFFFKDIAPNNMGDKMTATFSNGTYTDTVEYSVKDNLYSLIADNADNTKLVTLCADLLNYGAAAQKYLKYDVENLVNADLTVSGSDISDATANTKLDNNAVANGIYFKSAKVFCSNVNKIVITLVADKDTTLTIDGKEFKVYAGEYTLYSDAIAASKLATQLEFVLSNGTTTATLNYSVADYAASKIDAEGAMGELAKALYAYAKSAAAYAEV